MKKLIKNDICRSINSAFVHCLRTHKYHFLLTSSLKIGPTILFIYLKIILLQYFSILVFNFQLYSYGPQVKFKYNLLNAED